MGYTESAEYFIEAAKQAPGGRWWLHALVALLVGAVVGFRAYLERDPYWPFWSGFGVIVYAFVISGVLQRWQIRRWYKKATTQQNQSVRWEFSESEILQFTPVSSSRFDWSFATKVLQKRDGFLLYNPQKQYFWIPKQNFAAETDFNRLSELFRRKISNFVSV